MSFNFTVWAPVTRGDIRVFPAGGATPTVSTLNWEANILALANAAIVALGTGGAITVQVDGAGTIDLIVDVNGYYAATGIVNSIAPGTGLSGGGTGAVTLGIADGGVGSPQIAGGAVTSGKIAFPYDAASNYSYLFSLVNNGNGDALRVNTGSGMGVFAVSSWGQAVSGNSTNKTGIEGRTWSAYAGVWGDNIGSGPGVRGSAQAGWGVYGVGVAGGVYGHSDAGYGVLGNNPTGYALYCQGNGGYTGSWGLISDRRLKRDVEPLADGLQKVLALEAVSFHYRTDEFPERNLSEGRQIGLIAQDVEPVMPGVVVAGPDGYLSVDYARLTPILIEAVKAQQRVIQELTSRIEKLEGR